MPHLALNTTFRSIDISISGAIIAAKSSMGAPPWLQVFLVLWSGWVRKALTRCLTPTPGS